MRTIGGKSGHSVFKVMSPRQKWTAEEENCICNLHDVSLNIQNIVLRDWSDDRHFQNIN